MKIVKQKNKFATKKELEKYAKGIKGDSENVIISKNISKGIKTRNFGNTNIFAIAEPNRQLEIKNIMQMDKSYVIQDPNGELYKEFGHMLKENGYKVKTLNFMEPEKSTKYNPMNYLYNDSYRVCFFVEYIMNNISQEDFYYSKDKYFNMKKNFYAAIIFYMKDFSNETSSIKNIRNFIEKFKYDIDFKDMDHVFSSISNTSEAYKCYSKFREITNEIVEDNFIASSYEGSKKENPFYRELLNGFFNGLEITSKDEMELEKLCEEKTAIFIIQDSSNINSSNNMLISILFEQVYQVIMRIYEKRLIDRVVNEIESKDLISIQIMINDFANIGKSYDFLEHIACFPMYNMSLLFKVNDIEELLRSGQDLTTRITIDCFNKVYYPNLNKNNLQFFTKYLAKECKTENTDFIKEKILNLNENECIIYINNKKPMIDEMI